MSKIAIHQLNRLLRNWALRDGSIAQRLHMTLAELIVENAIPIGRNLPSERMLAQSLAVSRGSVSKAYALLQADGLIESIRGSGHMIVGTGRTIRLASRPHVRLQTEDQPRTSIIDMSSGALPPSAVARDVLQNLSGETLIHRMTGTGYFSAGLPELRERVARYYCDLGLPTQADEILITSGAKQALWLLGMALVAPADTVVVEDPTFRGALDTFRSHSAHLVPILVTSDKRINLSALESVLIRRPRLAYLFSEAANPIGLSLTDKEREELVALLNRHSVFLIEDGSQSELQLWRERPRQPLAASLDPEASATIGTMSKLFWGGVRIGWIRAAPKLVNTLSTFKAATDLGNSVLDQEVALQMFPRLNEARASRRIELQNHLASFESAFSSFCQNWSATRPDGGTAVWIELGKTDAAKLKQRALQHRLLLSAGPEFSVTGNNMSALRIPFIRETGIVDSVLQKIGNLS